MLRPFTSLCLFLLSFSLSAQMPTASGEVNYGNEWIDYARNYLRVSVAEDGMYRISPAQISAGLGQDITPQNADKWTLHHNGEAVPIEVTEQGIVFYGKQNRGELDRHLFPAPDSMQLNDRYSMHTDTAAYFLSFGEATGGPFYEAPKLSGTPVPSPSFLREREIVFSEFQSKKYLRSQGNSIYYSHYEPAEGFGSLSTDQLLTPDGATESLVEVPLDGATGAEATLSFRYGVAFGNHQQSVSIGGRELTSVSSPSWRVVTRELPFTPSGDVANVRFRGTFGDLDKANLAWVKVTYPATTRFDASLSQFRLPALRQDRRIALTDVGAAAGAMKVYGVANSTVATAVADGNIAVFDLPADGRDLTYQLVSGPEDYRTPQTSSLSFTATLPTDARTDYLLLTSRRLHGAAVEEMADYRRSPAGGNHRVHVVDVEDLYEEYGYGITRHPMAVRNYVAAARLVAPSLRFLFLVGKGREYRDLRKPADLTRARETYFLPSFGDPASDNLLTAGLGERTPDLATGRLAAINEREVAIYLKKLRDVEKQINEGEQSLVDREWMKQIMHLGGGGVPYEQRTIRNNLALLENTIEETELGAEVTSFFKTSSEPVEESRQAAIFERINNGTSIITFYGHSSSQGFDFSIDDPNNYFNFGKYPYILSLGCYSGDAFTEARSVSERFLFLEDKGAVAFAASKGLGFIGSLRVWANQLYDLMGNEYYGRGIGEAIRGNIDAFSTNGQGNGLYLGILLEQFSLSGDPAYRLHPRPGPDLVVDAGSVSFTPEVIPAQNDSFRVDFSLVNLGSNSGADSLSLTLEQELPSGERVSLRRIRVARPAFSSLEQISLPSLGLRAVGQNRLHITVDVDDEISEAPAPNAERNNILRNGEQAGVPLVFIANTARGVYPFNYSVIGGEIELISSTSNVLAEERDYVIQVATDKNFADLVEDRRITASGGVIRLQPGFAPVDETTYFWRISPDSTFTEGAGFIWDDNSFTWSAGGSATAAAWSLQHPGQLDDGAFTNILSTPTSERWNFARTANDITIINSVYRSNELPAFLWNGQPFRTQFPWDVTAGIQLTVIDSLNNVDWLDNPGDGTYGAVPGNAPGTGDVFSFDTRTEAGRLALIDFIDNVVEPGKYVTLFSAQRGGDIEYVNADWGQDSVLHGKSIFQVLEAQGANKVRQLADLGSVPYTFVFQKDFGPLAEGIAGGQDESISIVATIGQNWDEGNWVSPRIGPVSSLTDAQLDFGPSGISASDDCRLVIYGQPTPRAARTPLLDTELQLQDQLRFTLDLSEVAVVDYPYLSATLEFEDSQQLSVPSLLRFRLTATGYGDVAISPTIARELPDSVEQGEEVIFRLGYENVTPVGMDSLLAEFTVVDGNNEERQFRKRLAPLPGNGSGSVEFPLVTADLFADFRWQLELNPRQDQPEPVTFNNFTSNRVPLGRDQIAPHMSLFFDGVNILDGDLVSAAPEILIRLKDENNELLLRDTSLLRITLQEPSGNRSRISFADSRIEFLPASEANNVAEIFFRPTFLESGRYQLELRGEDASGNSSGRQDLVKAFEVVTEQSISNVLTYPNPFSTRTQFVYTLTGSAPPDVFRVQIMTVSGRVVRDIDLAGTETLKPGTHRTEFAWDGTDEYGDQLANGVYLYRVITRDAGEEMELRESSVDQYFRNGLGKVVILR